MIVLCKFNFAHMLSLAGTKGYKKILISMSGVDLLMVKLSGCAQSSRTMVNVEAVHQKEKLSNKETRSVSPVGENLLKAANTNDCSFIMAKPFRDEAFVEGQVARKACSFTLIAKPDGKG
ncbi:hypothetical protein HMPREF0201_02130 [Cedecea davisae DSM 4568]|uniref:Uncharacterized protein n=2 Tax=Enterobacteriaceae TaxID=543 RepID=S3IV91_9ENTR|nr:hypothetical protein HMPREF0201_02130 [Cedecea davisae DSM 4568]